MLTQFYAKSIYVAFLQDLIQHWDCPRPKCHSQTLRIWHLGQTICQYVGNQELDSLQTNFIEKMAVELKCTLLKIDLFTSGMILVAILLLSQEFYVKLTLVKWHSQSVVEISWFFCNSDFTWNQFCPNTTFRYLVYCVHQ